MRSRYTCMIRIFGSRASCCGFLLTIDDGFDKIWSKIQERHADLITAGNVFRCLQLGAQQCATNIPTDSNGSFRCRETEVAVAAVAGEA